MLLKWWDGLKGNNLHTWLLKTLPSLIVWNIWKARCKARFEDCDMNSSSIISIIHSNIVELYNAFKLHIPKGNCSDACLSFF